MADQAELFPSVEYVDLGFGMTARSTRRKQPPTKKAIDSTNHQNLTKD